MNGLRCRPGDLAVVLHSVCGNEGRIVRCLRLATKKDMESRQIWYPGPLWVVDGRLNSLHILTGESMLSDLCPDGILRPIRDPGDDAVDEMTLIAGKPTEVTAWI